VGSPVQALDALPVGEVTASADRRFAVKAGLTPGRPRRVVENSAYAAFVGRAVRAYGRRIGAGDVEALADLIALSTEIDDALSLAVAGLRQGGYSWAEIAGRIGVTRQAAQQRWGSVQAVSGRG